MNILDKIILCHTHVANSNRQAEHLNSDILATEQNKNIHLLHLELDGGLEVENLGIEVVRVSHQRGELSCLQDITQNIASRNNITTNLVEARAQKPWNLLDESVRGKEGIVLLGQPFDLFLVLVQLLQVISGHEVNALCLRLVTMLLISQQTNLELQAWHMLQPIKDWHHEQIFTPSVNSKVDPYLMVPEKRFSFWVL